MIDRKYIVGCYIASRPHIKLIQDELIPMSHKEAMTFISKHSNPSNYFVLEVPFVKTEEMILQSDYIFGTNFSDYISSEVWNRSK